MQQLHIATRNSRLALWQAKHLADVIGKKFPQLQVELLGMTTEGDKRIDTQLYKLGGKGLFLKELETALVQGRAQVAVHSAKDVPAALPEGLQLCACLPRQDPRDAFVATNFTSLEAMPEGAIIGTSSLRRASILCYYYPHLSIRDVRGNLETRLAKLDAGEYQALVLACAGLERLGLQERIRCRLPIERFVPAIGQGIIAMEASADNPEVHSLLAQINHAPAWRMLCAERAFGARLEADCHLPVAAHAWLEADGTTLTMTGMIAASDGSELLMQTATDADPLTLGKELAECLLARGAARLLGHNHLAR